MNYHKFLVHFIITQKKKNQVTRIIRKRQQNGWPAESRCFILCTIWWTRNIWNKTPSTKHRSHVFVVEFSPEVVRSWRRISHQQPQVTCLWTWLIVAIITGVSIFKEQDSQVFQAGIVCCIRNCWFCMS